MNIAPPTAKGCKLVRTFSIEVFSSTWTFHPPLFVSLGYLSLINSPRSRFDFDPYEPRSLSEIWSSFYISFEVMYSVLTFLLSMSCLVSLAEVWNPRVNWIYHKFEKKDTSCSFPPNCNLIVFPAHCFYEMDDLNWQCSFNLNSSNGGTVFIVSSYSVSCSKNHCALHADVKQVMDAPWLLGFTVFTTVLAFVSTILYCAPPDLNSRGF